MKATCVGDSTLHWIAGGKDVLLAQKIIGLGGDINMKGLDGGTPLYNVRNVAMLKFLLENRADIRLAKNDGVSVWSYISSKSSKNYDNHTGILDLLREECRKKGIQV